MNKTRVEAVTDGVFAIAITLLVLSLAQPDDYGHLTRQLAERWPSLAAYVVSFAVIGIMWFNHHSIFGRFDHVDRPLFFLNLLLLMTVAILPYPTGVLGEALRKDQGARPAAVFYSIVMAFNAYAWASLWLYATVGRRLLQATFPEAQRRIATILFTSGALVYTLAVGVALINAYLCLTLHGVLALYYALDPVSRRAARP